MIPRDVMDHARHVASEFELCNSCLGRMYARQVGRLSCSRLGYEIRRGLGQDEPAKCRICGVLCRSLDAYLDRFANLTDGIEFSSFAIGVTLRPSVLDRDDEIRSRYRLQGTGGIKTEIARELARRFRRSTGTRIDRLSPDLFITVNFRKDTIDVRTAPIFVSGRYVKSVRGMPQRSMRCRECGGSGCSSCCGGRQDAESVEGSISKFLCGATGSEQARISCAGGEDRESLVLGDGRPFLARLLNPRRRRCAFPDASSLPGIELRSLAVVPGAGPQPTRFHSVIRILVGTQDEVSQILLRSLKTIPSDPVMIYEDDGKINRRAVRSLRYRRVPAGIVITVEAEGGLPVKRFVEGDGINPSISDMLETRCVCRRFDFLQVSLEDPPERATTVN